MKNREQSGNQEGSGREKKSEIKRKKTKETKEKKKTTADSTIERCLEPWRNLSREERVKHIEESAKSLADDTKSRGTESIFDPLPGVWGPKKRKKVDDEE